MTTKMVSIRLDEELVNYLQHQADKEYRTLSGYIQSVLMKDKSLNGRPKVNVGDKIKCQDGIATITDIDEFEDWSIVWSDGKKDSVPTICQHNWKKALSQEPTVTSTDESGVMYYPQVEGFTPTVVSKEPSIIEADNS